MSQSLQHPRPDKSPPPVSRRPDDPPVVAGPPAAASPDGPVEKLTPEEQLERYAQELKNEDWGHQPC